jgi:hypothetical protein
MSEQQSNQGPASQEEAQKAIHGFSEPGAAAGDGNSADYESMTAEELHQLASERDIEGRSGMAKADLVKALKKSDKAK